MLKRKGYPVNFGYIGYLPSLDCWRVFSTEEEYNEIFFELEGAE